METDIQTATDSDSLTETIGQWIGSLIAEIPAMVGDFFAGLGEGAGVSGAFDWLVLIVGFALFLGAVKGLMSGQIVSSVIGGAIGVALIGLAVS